MRLNLSILLTAFATVSTLLAAEVVINPGDDWGAAISNNPAGTVFIIKAGIHPDPEISDAKNGMQFIGEDGAIAQGDTSGMYFATGYGPNGKIEDVVIKNIEIRGYGLDRDGNVGYCDGGPLSVHDSKNWLLEELEVHHCGGTGITTGEGTIVRNCWVHHNFQQGFGGKFSGATVEGCENGYNNVVIDGVDSNYCAWEHSAGGSKWAICSTLVVKNCWTHHNYGPGWWTDISNEDITYTGCLVEENVSMGIFHEISGNATINCNISRNNGIGPNSGSNFQLHVVSSGPTELWGNIMDVHASGGAGYQVTENGREYLAQDVDFHHNIIVYRHTTGPAVGMGCQIGGGCDAVYNDNAQNIDFHDNTYYVPDASAELWQWDVGDCVDFTTFKTYHSFGRGSEVIETGDFPDIEDLDCPTGCEDVLAPEIILRNRRMHFEIGQGGSASPQVVSVGNMTMGTLADVETDISYVNGSGWLNVARSGSGNTQKLTNTIDVSGVSAGDYSAKVRVSASNADYVPWYWVHMKVTGESPALTSFDIVPSNAVCSPEQSIKFIATALDQWDNPLADQPSDISWSVTGDGSVSNGTYTAGTEIGAHTLTVSSGGVSTEQPVRVLKADPLDMSENIKDFLVLCAPGGSPKLNVSNYAGSSTHVMDDEHLLTPAPGDKVTVGGTDYTWTIMHDDDGQWHDDAGGGEWIAYFAITVLSTKDQWVRYNVRHAGGMRIYSNGLKVYGYNSWDNRRAVASDPALLERGANQVIFKLASNTYPRFSAHIDDAQSGGLLTDLYYTLDDAAGGDLTISGPMLSRAMRPLGISVRRSAGRYVLDVAGVEGSHEVRVLSLNGRTVFVRRGMGEAAYMIPRSKMASSVYVVSVRAGEKVLRKRFIGY
ncbi:MAG: hypothetical protein GF418_13465 [Chitinivibrionales bacterium]|nr:hypothetical protein [Chitinivibrionales bacterium]MBD3396628.1 hypothetical protein [Chitinivibrionales bacterium]